MFGQCFDLVFGPGRGRVDLAFFVLHERQGRKRDSDGFAAHAQKCADINHNGHGSTCAVDVVDRPDIFVHRIIDRRAFDRRTVQYGGPRPV